MSVFRVKLNSATQGTLDQDPRTGLPFETSIQKTIYVTGPTLHYRKLRDGDVFTDCNYWLRFCYGVATSDVAFLELVTDDGSLFVDPVTTTGVSVSNSSGGGTPKTYTLDPIAGNTSFTDVGNYIDFLADTGGAVTFAQITNSGSADLGMELNGSTDAVLTLAAGDTQIFSHGDLTISKIAFSNETGGAGSVDLLVGVAGSNCS